jgi:hypothetical protein
LSPILGIIASQNYPRITSSYESIATVTVGSGGTTNIEFTSIPSTYTHLQIRGILRTNEAGSASNSRIRINSDSSSNYAYHYLVGDGGSAYSGAASSQTSGLTGIMAGGTATSGIFGGIVIDILDYANTNKNKTIRSLAGLDLNGSGGRIEFCSSLWMSSSAITSIKIDNFAGGNIVQYSQLALYGIKS